MSTHYTYTETIVQGAVYKDRAPKRSGYTTYVNGSVDTNVLGDYEITYTMLRRDPFDSIVETRLVSVIATGPAAPVGTIVLNGDAVVTVSLADAANYADAGATSSDGTVFVTNLDGTSSESFTGLPSLAGSYTLTYYLSGGLNSFVTRTVHVTDPNSGGGGGSDGGGGGGGSAPAIGYPITSLEYTAPPVTEDPEIKPAIGYPITSLEYTAPPVTEDPEIKPAIGYPIASLEDTTPTVTEDPEVKPATGYPITSLEE